jgi:hypothetical protein
MVEGRPVSGRMDLFVSQLQRGLSVTEDAGACPNEQRAQPPARTGEMRCPPTDATTRLTSGSARVEKVLMSGLAEGS